jgi:hypothetical protein
VQHFGRVSDVDALELQFALIHMGHNVDYLQLMQQNTRE